MKLQVSELKGKSFEERLQIWAKEVVPYCDEIARKYNRAFYAFQSDPKENPEVLLLGLNPGGKYLYIDEKELKGQCTTWNFSEKGMTPKDFIKPNPFDNTKVKWTIWRGLKKTINVHPALESLFDDMVYINLLYFNSANFGEFQQHFKENWKAVFDKCTDFSKFLIFEIIKPKRIVCLGNHCFPQFTGKNVDYQNRVKTCTLNNIPIFGIEHPSARLSNEKRENIGKELVKLFEIK